MIRPDQIPDEAVEAAAELFADAAAYRDLAYEKEVLDIARRTVAAALAAWPGAKPAWFLPQGKVYMLPAPWENKGPQESSNDA